MNHLSRSSFLTMFTLIIIACLAHTLNAWQPLLSSAFYAVLLGLIGGNLGLRTYMEASTLQLVSSNFMNVAVIFLATGLSLSALGGIGLTALPLIIVAVITAILGGNYLGRRLGLTSNTSMLVAAATAICGGSAMMTVAPVIGADDDDIAFGFSTLVLSNLISLLVIPLIGRWKDLSDLAYGILAGIAGKDTAVAVAIGYSYNLQAGEIATIVKLTRTLMIVPLVIGIIIYQTYQAKQKASERELSFTETVFQATPRFIFYFLGVIAFVSLFPLPSGVVSKMQELSGFLMTMALACIGMKADLKALLQKGLPVIFLGEVTWWLVIIVTIVLLPLIAG